jgi:hypothetical protein
VWSFSGGEVEVAPQFQPLEPGETELRIRKKAGLHPEWEGSGFLNQAHTISQSAMAIRRRVIAL